MSEVKLYNEKNQLIAEVNDDDVYLLNENQNSLMSNLNLPAFKIEFLSKFQSTGINDDRMVVIPFISNDGVLELAKYPISYNVGYEKILQRLNDDLSINHDYQTVIEYGDNITILLDGVQAILYVYADQDNFKNIFEENAQDWNTPVSEIRANKKYFFHFERQV